MLPLVSFGFPEQNTNCLVLNYRNSKWLQGSVPSTVATLTLSWADSYRYTNLAFAKTR